jgi:hypothetical protein
MKSLLGNSATSALAMVVQLDYPARLATVACFVFRRADNFGRLTCEQVNETRAVIGNALTGAIGISRE